MICGGGLRHLSLFGWISVALCGLLCAIFNWQSIENNWLSVYTYYDNDNNDDLNDDNDGGSGDKCYPSLFPNSNWNLILKYGVCFDSLPNNYTTSTSTGITKVNTGSNGGDKYCWSWDYIGANGERFWSHDGTAGQYCQYLKDTHPNNDDSPDDTYFYPLNCKGFTSHADNYQTAAKIGKAGIAFAALVCALGLFGAVKLVRNDIDNIEFIQGFASGFMILCCFLSIAQISVCVQEEANPFRILSNNMAFGCLPGWLKGYTLLHVKDDVGEGGVLCFVSLWISFIMGCICMTRKDCNNKCCCPCCFVISDSDKFTSTNFVTHYVNNNMNTLLVTPNPYDSSQSATPYSSQQYNQAFNVQNNNNNKNTATTTKDDNDGYSKRADI